MNASLRLQRRARNRGGPSVSLFPFLAVLICTMGALMPLLLAITRTARLQAEAAAMAKASEQEGDLKTAREDVKWRIEQLKQSREKTEAQVADARLGLGHLEDHARRLREKLAQYERTIADIEESKNAGSQQAAANQAELDRLRTQIEVAKQQVGEARQASAERNRCYAVVPYEGPNQTRRRPIYLECRADAVILQPEGIEFTEEDFEGPLGPGNPLAASLRAAREYLLSQRDFDPESGEPYPMLLVRSEGINAYYAARAAMKTWGFDFGYELVDDGWKLAYPPPDQRLAGIVRQVAASARVTQARLIAAAPRAYDTRPKSVYHASSTRGGFVREPGGPDDDRRYVPATASGKVAGNASSGGYGNGAAGGGVPGGVPGGVAGGVPGGVPGGVAGGVPGGVAGDGVPGEPGGSGSAYGGTSSGAGGYAGGVGGPGGDATAGGSDVGGNAGGGHPLRNGSADDASSGPMLTAGDAFAAGDANGSSAPGLANDSAGGAASTQAANGRRASSNAVKATEGTAASSDRVKLPEGYVVGQPAREHAQLPQQTIDDPQQPQVAERREAKILRPGEWEPKQDPPPKRREEKPPEDPDKRGRRPPERSLAEKRGENWGLRDAARGSFGVTRPIHAECYADRLVIVADRNPETNRIVPFGPRTASSVDLLISNVWEHMEGWGIAGSGMYWRPVLQVHVTPGAEQRFADLESLLAGSGITVVRK